MRKEGKIVTTTNGKYSWSFMTQIFRRCQPNHGRALKTVDLMTSRKKIGHLSGNVVYLERHWESANTSIFIDTSYIGRYKSL